MTTNLVASLNGVNNKKFGYNDEMGSPEKYSVRNTGTTARSRPTIPKVKNPLDFGTLLVSFLVLIYSIYVFLKSFMRL